MTFIRPSNGAWLHLQLQPGFTSTFNPVQEHSENVATDSKWKRSGAQSSLGLASVLSKLQGDGSGTDLLCWMRCGCLGNHPLCGFSHHCPAPGADGARLKLVGLKEQGPPAKQLLCLVRSMQAGITGLLHGRKSLARMWCCRILSELLQSNAGASVNTLGYLSATGWGQCWGLFWLLDCWVSCWGLGARGLFQVQLWANA